MTNFEGNIEEDKERIIMLLRLFINMSCFNTSLSLSITLMIIYILPSVARMYKAQEVCIINYIQILTRIWPMI